MSATDDLSPWWVRSPARVRWELSNFADAGLPATHHRDQIHTQVTLSDGREVAITVHFPFEYPLAPPTVKVQIGLLGPPHEVAGRLCLLDNPGSQWHPQRSAAEMVHVNARGLLEAALIGGTEALAEVEEQIPMLAERLYVADRTLVVLVPDPFWGELSAQEGWFTLTGEGERRLLATLLGLAGAEGDVDKRVRCDQGIALGRWLTLPEAPRGRQDARSLLSIGQQQLPSLLEPLQGPEAPFPVQWVALTYPCEGPMRGQSRRGWSFIALPEPGARALSETRMHRLAATQALTPSERALRLPELAGIEQARILVLGAGSLGSKIALELAKAGAGYLILCDHDTYDVNNAVRHELSPAHAGEYKAHAMARACMEMNPFCEAIGDFDSFGTEAAAAEKFIERLARSHLVIEATGSREVARIAERYCRAAGVPLLTVSLTRGSRGGDMLLLRPDLCLDCFLLAQQEQRIPSPVEGEQPHVMPVGCQDPAFSGAGFDASELASTAARMAVRATGLCAYPALDHNWAVLNFTGEPHLAQGTVLPDPACGHR